MDILGSLFMNQKPQQRYEFHQNTGFMQFLWKSQDFFYRYKIADSKISMERQRNYNS